MNNALDLDDTISVFVPLFVLSSLLPEEAGLVQCLFEVFDITVNYFIWLASAVAHPIILKFS